MNLTPRSPDMIEEAERRGGPAPPRPRLGRAWSRHRVRSHRWDKLPSELNVADYDVVMLNFAAFEDRELAEGFPQERLPGVESMARWSSGAEVIAIGNPSTLIGSLRENGFTRSIETRDRCDYWLPVEISVEENTGTQYDVEAEEWASFFEHLSGWRWFATGYVPSCYYAPTEYLQPVTDKAHHLFAAFQPIATTRFGKQIALRVHLRAIRYGRFLESYSGMAEGDPRSAELVLEAASVFWLPAPDPVSVEDAIDAILAERYGIARVARVPDWVVAYSLPAEAPIASEIALMEQERQDVEQRMSEARTCAAEAARARLCSTEAARTTSSDCSRTLRELGAGVEDPEAKGIEDGKLFRGEGQAALEIKGQTGSINLQDVRQVVQWETDATAKDGINYKPLIVGNPHCDKPLEAREQFLAPNAAAHADTPALGVLTTAQLFEALSQKQAGSFDEAHFWEVVFETVGVADLTSRHPLTRSGPRTMGSRDADRRAVRRIHAGRGTAARYRARRRGPATVEAVQLVVHELTARVSSA